MLSGTLTIPAAIARACRWHTGEAALVDGDRQITYAELDDLTRRVASALRDRGVRKGDRVAFLSDPSADHAIAYYGAQRVGAVTVNLHERETVAHQEALLTRLTPRVLVHTASKQELVQQLSQTMPDLQTVCLEAAGGRSLADLLLAAPIDHDPSVDERDAAVIQLSSGSTGQPKALVHSHASVLHTWHGGLNMWSGIASGDRYLNAFSTSFSVWLIHAGAFLNQGGSVVLLRQWDPVAFFEAVATHRITCAALTPTQWRAVLEAGPEQYDRGSLRMAAYLGEKLAPEHLEELTRRVCPQFSSFYGMTECLGLGGCVIRSAECIELGKWGSVGRPNLNSDLRIDAEVGQDGANPGPGTVGEVQVRSPSFADENLGDPDWQARVLTPDGWYRTGDLGYVDKDGYLFLTGRADNMILTGGVNVAAEEIEQVIETNPDVAEVVVLGRPDDTWGERIVAAVVPKVDALTPEELDRWCAADGRLAKFKRPREWRLFPKLPQNSAGKRDRIAVAAQWRDG